MREESRTTIEPGPLRVLTAQSSQYYHRLLYDPISCRVEERDVIFDPNGLPDPAALEDQDVFHLHSPEDLPFGDDVRLHQVFAEHLRDAGLALVWTQHNFGPHDVSRRDRYVAIYELWARGADMVIHHSQWGMAQCRAILPFPVTAAHRVIPHGHFGPLMPELATLDPEDCRAELGLRPGLTCVGIIGHPRVEKQVAMAMRAFARAARDDLQLLVLSLRSTDVTPRHQDIVGLVHQPVARPTYNRRLRSIDVALMPFAPGMLTTGSVADVIGLGVPAIVSDWPFLTEVFGGAAIVYGADENALVSCLAGLSPEALARSRDAMSALQGVYDYNRLSWLMLDALRAATFGKSRRMDGAPGPGSISAVRPRDT